MSEPKDIREGLKQWLDHLIEIGGEDKEYTGNDSLPHRAILMAQCEELLKLPDPPDPELQKITKRAKEIISLEGRARFHSQIKIYEFIKDIAEGRLE